MSTFAQERIFDVPKDGVVSQATKTEAEAALEELAAAAREALVADARIENARRALANALDGRVDARQALRDKAREARLAGATFPQIAAVLDVSVQRAHALVNAPEVGRR